MAHQDDFEFCVGGTFALLRKKYGDKVKIKILTLSRGASGHHLMGLEETFRRRGKEAQNSVALIGAEYECMRCLDGSHIPAQVFVNRNVLGGLWNAIRNFKPDYIFCPPVISDPLAGIHIDHFNTACAVRMVAYQLIVPHAYPTIDGETELYRKMPLIINVDDSYANTGSAHIANDVSEVYELKKKMLLCHESQVFEWLPWSKGKNTISSEEFDEDLLLRHQKTNTNHGIKDDIPREFFTFTNWGRSVEQKDIDTLFPNGIITSEGEKIFDKHSHPIEN